MAKALVFFAEGFEEIEALTVVDLLRRAGMDTKMVSVTGDRKVTGANQITVMADVLFEEENYDEADILVLPGGMPGTLNLMEHKGLDLLLKKFHAEGKALAAICAAPTVFGAKGLLMGKRATCYPGMEDRLTGAIITNALVVVDGNITTSKGLGTAIDFALTMVKHFEGKEKALCLAEKIQYQYYNA